MKNELDYATNLVLECLHRDFPIPPEEEFEGWSVPRLDVLDCVLSLNRSYEEALVLMEAAGKHLEWPLSRLDYAVWDRGARGNENLRGESSTSEIVLKIGAEGGSLTIVREAVWQFRIERNESAIRDLLSEDDQPEVGNFSARTECVKSFHEALNLLDKYPWFRLHAL